MILPGATLGMLGGGQLGRLFTLAAHLMGYRVVVYDPDPLSPAGAIADEHICSNYSDETALESFCGLCDVISTEFENIPADILRKLSDCVRVCPSAAAVELTQHRAREKNFIRKTGLKTANFIPVSALADLENARGNIQFPAILKRAELGYDGKGQIVVNTIDELEQAFLDLEQLDCVLEEKISLKQEISVILGRSQAGESHCFPVAENVHRNGVLHSTAVPADIKSDMVLEAEAAAIRLADTLEFCGVMAVEFFISTDGQLLVNEIAPRTHNSGHYSLDACMTSQFEQQVRMICGLPFGDTQLLAPVSMINLLGDLWQQGEPDWGFLLSNPKLKLHLYGKQSARPGRKMGHFTCLGQTPAEAEKLFEQLKHGNS